MLHQLSHLLVYSQNKTASAVQLTHTRTGLVVKSQATRSRSQNLKIATQLLADKIDQRENGEHSRAAIVERYKSKKKASRGKKSRRKYRALEEEKMGTGGEEGGEQDEGDGVEDGVEDGGGDGGPTSNAREYQAGSESGSV